MGRVGTAPVEGGKGSHVGAHGMFRKAKGESPEDIGEHVKEALHVLTGQPLLVHIHLAKQRHLFHQMDERLNVLDGGVAEVNDGVHGIKGESVCYEGIGKYGKTEK